MTLKELEEKTGLEVAFRSCWKCNSAHDRLKKVKDFIIYCFECGEIYYMGRPLTDEKLNELEGKND